MELYQLKTFLAVAETANLTRAAARLHHSPSAVSSQVKALEAHLGVPLFRRTSRGMVPTPEGQSLIPRARKVVQAAHSLETTARELAHQPRGSLAIGINTTPDLIGLSTIQARSGEVFPRLKLSFTETRSNELADALVQGQVDLGFHFGPMDTPQIRSTPLRDIPICVGLPPDLPTIPESWEALAALPWVWSYQHCPYHQSFAPRLEKRGLSISPVADAVDETIVAALVKSGTGAALMPLSQARDMAKRGEITIWDGCPPFPMPLSVACLENRIQEPGLSSFMALLGRIFTEKRNG
ncbi:MAG: LysR family transcriptional regulator [Desulfobacterales bacterium]|nr:LysR family transcriptional regulator [Desulfobacterales bacterium]